MSSGFGYFMSAAIVLMLCLITYIMLHRLVRVEDINLSIIYKMMMMMMWEAQWPNG